MPNCFALPPPVQSTRASSTLNCVSPAAGRVIAIKITVYLSSAELLELEQAKVTLRGYGISTDRGRIVREALAVLLADLEVGGEQSLMVRRLREGR